MYNLALIILHLEQNNGVRVGPHQLRHDCVFYFRYSSFVRCVSVMREQRHANREHTRTERKSSHPCMNCGGVDKQRISLPMSIRVGFEWDIWMFRVRTPLRGYPTNGLGKFTENP